MALVLDAFMSRLGERLNDYAKEEEVMRLGVHDEIDDLRTSLEKLRDLLADAEKRRLESSAVDQWLAKLRDVLYYADDVIDECQIEGEKLLIGSNYSSSSRAPPLVPSCCPLLACHPLLSLIIHNTEPHHEIGDAIRRLNSRLEGLYKDKDDLHLAPSPRDAHRASHKASCQSADPMLVGDAIEKDTKSLVDLLIREREEKLPLFAIVGEAGIGKTALARKIYRDKKLEYNFSRVPRVWVSVSRCLSETELLKAIAEGVGGDNIVAGGAERGATLETNLEQLVKNKRLFLVLDDVRDARVWEDAVLRKVLDSSAPDSRVLITTRDEAIANQMGAAHIHRVEKLSSGDGWSLVCDMVFGDSNEKDKHTLGDIGIPIVEKCDGLPLALRAVAGVLRTREKARSEWEAVLSSSAWSYPGLPAPDNIPGALYVSYEDLPSRLKQCLICLSFFPSHLVIERSDFVNACIAQGFIAADEEDMSSEELAEECWEELVHRSLLQPDSAALGCQVHDLVHSLAQHVAHDECFIGDVGQFRSHKPRSSSSIKLRHLSLVDAETIPHLVLEHSSLRTMAIFGSPHLGSLPRDLPKTFRALRFLHLGRTSIHQLPSSVGELTHLRYLDLSATQIRELPDSIRNLRYLLFLILVDCKYLHRLPDVVVELARLRSLHIIGTPIDGMPKGVGRLQQLNSIDRFVVNSGKGDKSGGRDNREHEHHGRLSALGELESLSELRFLSIFRLERVPNRAEASAAMLAAKPHLKHLHLCCTPPISYDNDAQLPICNKEDIKKIEEVFEELCSPPSLENLGIHGYFGCEYPSWMTSRPLLLTNLQSLELNDCDYCERLPSVGLLPQLERLIISGASAVTRIGPEFFMVDGSAGATHSQPAYFPKLKQVHFMRLPNWEEWSWPQEDHVTSSLSCLETMHIADCPKLKSLPEGLVRRATALKTLSIVAARSLAEIKDFSSVGKLVLTNNASLERITNLPALKSLSVEGSEGCWALKVLEGLKALEFLSLTGPYLEFLWPYVGNRLLTAVHFPKIQKIYLQGGVTTMQ